MTQQWVVEDVVDTMMANVIDAMSQSQSLTDLRRRLLQHMAAARLELEKLELDGEYVYDGASY